MTVDPSEVLSLLPQKEPVQWLDAVECLEPGSRVVARHDIPVDASYFEGHFPGDPVVPGVVQIDALVQAAALLVLGTEPPLPGRQVLMMGLDRVRFRRRVAPGESLRLEVTVVSRRGPVWKVDGEASVAGETATQARLLLNVGSADIR
jgi:3-hydroxyacyl-[acyl-carrier-protein] dehydratase